MIIVEKAKHENGILLKGDFFDLDRLYFAIYKYTGFHGIDSECTFPGYYIACENLLGLCYEIRHAWQGDRNIELVYNGIHEYWFDDYQEPYQHITDDNQTLDLCDEEPEDYSGNFSDKSEYKFSRKEFPDLSFKNTYFSIHLTFPEAIFYSLILLELLKKKDVFLMARKLLIDKKDELAQLNKEYYYFHANEDIARLTLFTNQSLHAFYSFIGEERYTVFMNKFNKQKNFLLNCDLDHMNSVIADYAEKEYKYDDPDQLFDALTSLF